MGMNSPFMPRKRLFYCLFFDVWYSTKKARQLDGHGMNYLLKRLKEPSTWAGIGLILTAITPVLPLAYATPIGALIGVCGGIAYILREGKTDAK